ncbi:MAG: hypothetical protein UW55_C0033G0003 [Candidatus Giovannonibacteria bacterium GW2011_GWA2_44_26]|uniref:Uncharacterized protein n=1 Tax=Candidatus Giovannonibacteria bacterium GW2011_GWA2_44_26 TaxID=1618648 RepID=A0A0G1KYA3_9BACT|nr:MAG: hypothetical protein UW55_C0033G0003 [Candidatus Giovannonibacteria bacterium GW2011_GWA2_44_26]
MNRGLYKLSLHVAQSSFRAMLCGSWGVDNGAIDIFLNNPYYRARIPRYLFRYRTALC